MPKRSIDQAISYGVLLAVCCLLSYKIMTSVLIFSAFVSRDDELLGGMWAVIATIFVLRRSYEESANAALLRTSATLLSFALCLVYLLIFPFRIWGLIVLIAIGAIVLDLIGRSEDCHHGKYYNHGGDGCSGDQPPACVEATHPAVN